MGHSFIPLSHRACAEHLLHADTVPCVGLSSTSILAMALLTGEMVCMPTPASLLLSRHCRNVKRCPLASSPPLMNLRSFLLTCPRMCFLSLPPLAHFLVLVLVAQFGSGGVFTRPAEVFCWMPLIRLRSINNLLQVSAPLPVSLDHFMILSMIRGDKQRILLTKFASGETKASMYLSSC